MSTSSYSSKTRTYSGSTTSGNHPIIAYKLVATRSPNTSDKVTITATCNVGWTSSTAGSTFSDPFKFVITLTRGNQTKTISCNVSTGTSTGTKGTLCDQDSTTAYGIKSATGSATVDSWTDSNSFSVSATVTQAYLNETKSFSGGSLSMPTQSSSSGGGSSSTTVDCKVTSFSASPKTVEVGGLVTFTCSGTSGTNSDLAGFYVTTTLGGTSGSTYTPSGGTVSAGGGSGSRSWNIYAPSAAGSYTYYAYAVDSNGKESSGYKSVTITVTEAKPTLTCNTTSLSRPTGTTSGSISVTSSSGVIAYGTSTSNFQTATVSSYGTAYISWSSGATSIKVWAYNSSNSSAYQFSSSYATISISYYTPVSISSITITPTVLKDNLTAPDLVNVVSGSASVTGANSYTWQYCKSATQTGFTSSWQDLGTNQLRFSNMNMKEKVETGYYYKFRLYAENSNDSDYSSESDIYQIPALPGSPTITKVVPKANPENGYTENTQDDKIYYGSGVFLTWTNPTISNSQMDIKSFELAYQQRKAGTTEWSSTSTAQFKYFNLSGTTYQDPPSTYSGASCGGGADLEVESLYETRVGIKITDTLGQTSETYYSTSYYKAESPGFGGDITRAQSSFRPFTCDESGYIELTSSLASASSQDELLYYIECYIPDRRETIELITGIPISTSAFSTSYVYDKLIYSDDNIEAYMGGTTTIRYKIKNSYFKQKLLASKKLRTPANNELAVYNDDYSDVVYKASVRDNFDSRSTVYNSAPITINFIEAPTFYIESYNTEITTGVNRYIKSENPFDDNSVNIITDSSDEKDRIVNPGESIVLSFMKAKDYNGADSQGDITGYNVYICRQDNVPNVSYDKLDYTLLRNYSASELKKKKPNDANNYYYYVEYPITSYQDSKFITFKVEAVDSKNNTSDALYSNTYLVPCRAQSMDYRIAAVKLYDSSGQFNPLFKLKVDDLGGATFVNSAYSYDLYPNFERSYSITSSAATTTFTRKCRILLEGCLDSNFDNHGQVTLTKRKALVATLDDETKTVDNWFSMSYDPLKAGELYTGGMLEENISFKDSFPTGWFDASGEKLDEEYISKIFFRVTTIIAYGLNDIEATDSLDTDRYLKTISITAPYSFYDDAPTVSYRNHQVGINTKDFSTDSNDGQQEVLIIQDNGSYNLVVFKGAEQKIILNLTERTFYTLNDDDTIQNEINFGDGTIDGMTIDGGSW